MTDAAVRVSGGRVLAYTETGKPGRVHGELDVLMPLAHSRHTSELIRDGVLRVLPAHGHMTPVSELPAIASALVRELARSKAR
jgi:pimeloyl-ACP methyl ester carboxylesterase